MSSDLIMDFRSLAKLISKIENNRAGYEDDLMSLYKENSETVTIGITGPPGAGTRGIVKSSEIKDGASVVDVGIHVTEEGKVTGDMIIDSENEENRINYSPVPGGVGMVTNAMMLYNLVQCRKLRKNQA